MAHGWHHKLDKGMWSSYYFITAHTEDYLVGWPFFSNTTGPLYYYSPPVPRRLLIVSRQGVSEALVTSAKMSKLPLPMHIISLSSSSSFLFSLQSEGGSRALIETTPYTTV